MQNSNICSSPRSVESVDCAKSSFIVIKNDGFDGVFKSACLWISISNALQISSKTKSYPTALTLREQAEFPSKSVQFELNTFDANETEKIHTDALRRICAMYNIEIHFYTANYSGGVGSTWIGQCGVIVGSESNNNSIRTRKFAIVNYGGHYELIVSKTPTTRSYFVNKRFFPQLCLKTYRYIRPNAEPNAESNVNSAVDSRIVLNQKITRLAKELKNSSELLNIYIEERDVLNALVDKTLNAQDYDAKSTLNIIQIKMLRGKIDLTSDAIKDLEMYILCVKMQMIEYGVNFS